MLISDFQLTYCTNIHPGESLSEVESVLFEILPLIKMNTSNHQKMGVGLRLSALAAKELNQSERLESFKNNLNQRDLYVFTMNGFPYGSFHGTTVKDKVHAPDWTSEERLEYTLDLIDVLTYLLPDGGEGGISTSPVSYKYWFSEDEKIDQAKIQATDRLVKVIMKLISIEEETGKYIHIDIEPEPDGLLENTSDVIDFFEKYLIPIGTKNLVKNLSLSEEESKNKILRYITVCYDICHFALAWEEPEFVISQFNDHSIRIGKIQISAALEVRFNDHKDGFSDVINQLSSFSESTYLHQVTVKKGESLTRYRDLDVCLQEEKDLTNSIWRIHFHVPVFIENYQKLFSTQEEILKVLNMLKTVNFSKHLEVETYTWEVLPEGLKEDLNFSICRELEWVKKVIESDGEN